MRDVAKTRKALIEEIAELRVRLAEPEDTVEAIRHGRVDAFVVHEPGGEQVYTMGTAELLRELQVVTDSLPVLVSYLDRDRRYRFVNRQYELWFGRAAHEFIGRTIEEVLGEATYERLRGHVDRVLAGHQVAFEQWISIGGEESVFVRSTLTPHSHDGVVRGWVAFVENATEGKRAEDTVRLLADAGKLLSEGPAAESADSLVEDVAQLAVPALGDWCFLELFQEAGASHRIACAHVDPARRHLLDELKLHPPSASRDSLEARVLRREEPELAADLRPGGAAAPEDGTGRAAPDNGSHALLQDSAPESVRILRALAPRSAMAVPLAAGGKKLGVWSFYTATRRLRQEDLDVAQELARRVAAALENARLYHAVESASRAKDRFLAALSHELRTPLAPVLAMASRLAGVPDLPPAVRAGLDLIRRNVELEARLINDLLDLARISRGRFELQRQPTDLREAIRQALETCDERQLASRRLVYDLRAEEHQVWSDPARLVQVFGNLLGNALKFTPEGGTIEVRSFVEAGSGEAPAPGRRHLVVEVSDSGIGIEPEALPEIFSASEQGEGSISRRFGGLGLGLAISKAIVEQHGGELAAASAGRNQGATFSVRLPLPERPVLETAPALSNRGENGVTAGSEGSEVWPAIARPLHVLLVEDHLDTAAAMAELMRSIGHRVSVAATVAEARAAAMQGGIDLLVSDLGLPDGDGRELMRSLAEQGVPGIALSGYGMEDDMARSREAGFALHLTKPVSWPSLEAAIRKVTGS